MHKRNERRRIRYRLHASTRLPSSSLRYLWGENPSQRVVGTLKYVNRLADETSPYLRQHRDNPDYPGDWDEYPELAWVQPTFPASGSRYPLSTEKTLVLRYRLIVHAGGKPDGDISDRI